MHALVLLSVNQQTKFEVPSLTSSKDVARNGSCDSDYSHSWVVCHPSTNTVWTYSMLYKM